MRFFGALRSLTSPERIAELFVKEFVKSSNSETGMCLQYAVDFINDCLLSINLECNITVEQIEKMEPYQWPKEQLSVYRFEYQRNDFQRFEKFLAFLFQHFRLENDHFNENKMKARTNPDDDYECDETPLYLLVELLAVWCNAFRNLLEQNYVHEKWLNEPLARISEPDYQLFLNGHELGETYDWSEPELKSVCKILYRSALKGLRYREICTSILNGLLSLCEKDFLTFHEYNSKATNFFYEAFSINYNDAIHLKIYECCAVVLSKNYSSNDENRKQLVTRILSDLLLPSNMLEVYYNTLINIKKNAFQMKILGQALIFLKLLQRQILDVNIFNVAFIEAILEICIHSKTVLGEDAADLYITIMRRMCLDSVILKHVLLYYGKHVNTPTKQSTFIKNVYKHFDYIHNYDNIYKIFDIDHGEKEIIRVTAARFLLDIATIKSKDSEVTSTGKELQQFLMELSNRIKSLNCQKSLLILLKLYRLLPIKEWSKDLTKNFINYATEVLMVYNKNVQYPLLMNIFCLMKDCLEHIKQWEHLGYIADSVMTEYLKMFKKRKDDVYCNIIKRLNILLKMNFELFDNVHDILKAVIEEFTQQPKNGAMHTFLDLYAIEIMCSCILKLSKSELEFYHSVALEKGLYLIKYLWPFLKNVKNLLKMPVMHIKTYFITIVILLICLPIQMESRIYQVLNEILIQVNFTKPSRNIELNVQNDESMQLSSEQKLQYQQLMLRHFIKLHQINQVQINTKIVWKLCIYYKLIPHEFNNELKELLKTLAKYRFDIYKHVLPVLIYNLYRLKGNLKPNTIKYTIQQHKQLMQTECQLKDLELLYCHIVLTILQIIEKSVQLHEVSQKSSNQHINNRLKPLMHLFLWLEDINFNRYPHKATILQQLQQLNNYTLSYDERELYSNFQKKVERL